MISNTSSVLDGRVKTFTLLLWAFRISLSVVSVLERDSLTVSQVYINFGESGLLQTVPSGILVFSRYRKKVWDLGLSFPAHTPFFPLLPQRKQQLLKLTEGLSPSVRHTNTAGKNRPPVFSRTSVCNLGAKLSLTSIDEHICTGFKPQHIFLQSIAKTWPPPAQLTIAAQTVALYLLNCRLPALDHSRALQQKSPSWSIAGSTLHALALTVKFKASCGIQILS